MFTTTQNVTSFMEFETNASLVDKFVVKKPAAEKAC